MNRTYSQLYRKAERLEDALFRRLGVVIDPHRQQRPVESETTESPRPRECPERPTRTGPDD